MSKNIWHITNQDENTTDVPEEEGFVVLIGHWASCLWYGGETPEPIFWENVKKWCFLDDLLALETELDRTRKALGYAIDVIQTVAKMSDKLSREYGETLVEQLDNIQAYCWQEGYVLTHEEDLERAITALEQKDVK